MIKECAYCGSEFESDTIFAENELIDTSRFRKYCSTNCRSKVKNTQNKKRELQKRKKKLEFDKELSDKLLECLKINFGVERTVCLNVDRQKWISFLAREGKNHGLNREIASQYVEHFISSGLIETAVHTRMVRGGTAGKSSEFCYFQERDYTDKPDFVHGHNLWGERIAPESK